MGNDVEREWAEGMTEAIEIKRQKLAAPGFEHFSINVLAVKDSLTLWEYGVDEACGLLVDQLKPLWSREPMFDWVLIGRETEFIWLTPDGVSRLPVPDLWPRPASF